MVEPVKQKRGKDFFSMTDNEIEQIMKKHFKKVLAQSHQMGLSTTHSDGKNIYKIHPDGTKEIVGKDIS